MFCSFSHSNENLSPIPTRKGFSDPPSLSPLSILSWRQIFCLRSPRFLHTGIYLWKYFKISAYIFLSTCIAVTSFLPVFATNYAMCFFHLFLKGFSLLGILVSVWLIFLMSLRKVIKLKFIQVSIFRLILFQLSLITLFLLKKQKMWHSSLIDVP
jgi:hypothetical protein